jgi:hypothetical protein
MMMILKLKKRKLKRDPKNKKLKRIPNKPIRRKIYYLIQINNKI